MKNRLILILNIAVILLFIAALWYGYRESRVLKSLYQELNAGTSESGQIKNWETLLAETTKERELISRSIVGDNELPSFIDELEGVATISKVELDLQSVLPADKTNPNIKLMFNVEGTYRQVFHFTGLVDSLPTQIKINRVEFNRRGETEDRETTPLWQVSFEIELINQNKNEKK